MPATSSKIGDNYYNALRARYAAERDRRLRMDGERQYVEPVGRYARYADRDPRLKSVPDREPCRDEIGVLIISAGWSGLLCAAKLVEAGVDDLRLVDDAGGFGGAWYWNQYPGAQCDVESYMYLPLLEETGYVPTEKYTFAPEIESYANLIATHYDLHRRALFSTRITEMRWNDNLLRWIVKTNRGDEIRARFVILGSGPTQRPKLPGIPGIDDFKGHTFHTCRWDFDYTGGDNKGHLHKLADKRVAIIGTGATAIQCVPHLGASAKLLYVFQRTPSAVDLRHNKPTDVDWFSSLTPGWQHRRRQNFDAVLNGRPFEVDEVADGWSDMGRKLAHGEYPVEPPQPDDSPELRALKLELADFHKMDELRQRVAATVKDEATAELLKPWYNWLCKRPVFNDEYLETFNRPNVTLIDTSQTCGVERITSNGIVAGSTEYEVDCIIFSTGFEQSGPYERRIGTEILGRDGVSLFDHWRQGMRTLHGHSVNGFPNWFYVGLGQVGLQFNFVAVVEPIAAQVAYIISEAERRGASVVEATAEGEQAWVDVIRSGTDTRFAEACTPGYYNNEGQIKTSAATFWGDFYMGGWNAFNEILTRWREEGRLEGMALR